MPEPSTVLGMAGSPRKALAVLGLRGHVDLDH